MPKQEILIEDGEELDRVEDLIRKTLVDCSLMPITQIGLLEIIKADLLRDIQGED